MVSQRYVLAFMAFMALFNGFAVRMNLSMAITKMTVAPSDHNGTTIRNEESVCPLPESVNSANVTSGGISFINASLVSTTLDQTDDRFDWSQELQGIILSAYFWGYFATNIPGGLLAQKFGGKYVLTASIFFPGILSILTPISVQYGGANALIAIRLLMGFFQGPMYPSLAALLSAWIPRNERGTVCSITYSGAGIGSFAVMYVCGLLLEYFSGWSSVFYAFGISALLWCPLFIWLCSNDPASHAYINESEKRYLQEEIGESNIKKRQSETPWRAILTSAPVLALLLTSAGDDWCYFVVAIDLPKYMSDVLHFSIKDNGIFSSLPYILRTVVSISSGLLSDWAVSRGYIGITASRKTAVVFASVFPAVTLISASYAGCDHTLVVILVTLSVGIQAAVSIATSINPMDISPNYASSIMGIVNAFSSITGILAPTVAGILTPNSLLSEWRLVFWITFTVHIIKAIIYLIWGSADVQPWNTPPTSTDNEEEEKALKPDSIKA